jgi:uncharacterized phosphosugar-binding protein
MTEAYRDYLRRVAALIETAQAQTDAIDKAAEMIVERIVSGRVIYVFGPSHAGLVAQDLFYRAGGLMPIQPILPPELMVNVRPITHTTHMEQLPGYGVTIIRDTPIGEGDLLLITSVSGRNPVVIEACQAAQARGATVIALTNLTYSRGVTPRSGGVRLFEAADLVIDLPGVSGDALIELDGLDQRVGPSSTAVGSAILQGLMVEVAARLLQRGIQPPVLVSANLDHGEERNQRLVDAYRGKVNYL